MRRHFLRETRRCTAHATISPLLGMTGVVDELANLFLRAAESSAVSRLTTRTHRRRKNFASGAEISTEAVDNFWITQA
jgi:hypothetical protein